MLARWLRRDAETGGPMAPRPELLELGFGLGPDDEQGAAEIGSFRLRGRIDRIDVSADGKALIRDYKLSSKVIAAKKLLEEGKLQMPLYIAAVRGMGMEPIGGVYHPLNATKERDDRPRGLLTAEHRDVLIPGDTDAHVGTDFLTDEVFDETIARRRRAGRRDRRRDPRGPDRPGSARRRMPDLVPIGADLPQGARDRRPRRGGRGGGGSLSPEAEQLSFDVGGGAEPGPAPARAEPTANPAETPPPAPAPTREQAAAIDSRDRDVFLEAGAGTGKTRVLVDRYCDAVDRDEVAPDRILAFTFTEKAAAEMRRRVRLELLRRAAAAADPEHGRRLREAARAGEAAPITTIHGFCRRLLAAHPVAAGLDPGFRVLDADESARLAVLAFDEALAELAAGDDAVAAIAAAYRPRRLRGLIRGAYDDLRNHGHRTPDLPPLQISAFEGKEHAERVPDPADLELAEASYGAIRELLVAFGRRYEAAQARAFRRRLRRPAAAQPRAAAWLGGGSRQSAGALRPPARR